VNFLSDIVLAVREFLNTPSLGGLGLEFKI
jgi:hypothetical protein